jgi:diacylglycerol O-acyltransferase / wax synthase
MSSRRLSTLDASFLEVESPSAHMHVGWSAVFRPPSGSRRPTFAEVRDHIAGRMPRAPRYRQKLADVPLGVNDPVWVDDDAFDVDRHVRRTDASDLQEATDAAMSRPLARDRPLWELGVADRLPDGRLGIVGKAHHAMADGLAAVELATLLLDPTPEPPPPEPDPWRPARKPTGLDLFVDGAVARVGEAVALAGWPMRTLRRPERLTNVASEGLGAVRALVDAMRPAAAQPAINEPISPHRHLARCRRPLDDLRHVKLQFGTTINDVVLAAAAGGLRRFLARRGDLPVPLKAMVPVSVRNEHGASELGNQISFVFIDLPCDDPNPLRRLVDVQAKIGERKRSGKPEGADRALKALAYAPRTVRRALSHVVASPQTFNLVVSNIPGPREPVYMLGCELEEVYPVVPLAERHGLSIGMTTTSDQACFGIYADRELVPDADQLAACLDESLDELLACANGR